MEESKGKLRSGHNNELEKMAAEGQFGTGCPERW